MTKRIAATSLAFLCFWTISSAHIPQGELETEQSKIDQSLPDSARIDAHIEQGNKFLSSDVSKAQFHFDEAITLAKKTEHTVRLGRAYYLRGLVEFQQNEFETALSYYEQAAEQFTLANYHKGLGTTYIGMGRMNHHLGRIDLSLDLLKQAAEAYHKAGDLEGEHRAYSGLSNIYRDKGNLANALLYGLKYCDWNVKTGNEVAEAMALNNLGLIYMDMSIYEKAIAHLDSALRLSEKLEDEDGIALASMSIGTAYLKTEQAEKAVSYLKRSVELYDRLNQSYYLGTVLVNLGTAYQMLDDQARAIPLIKRGKNILLKLGDDVGVGAAYLGLALSYATSPEYEERTNQWIDSAKALAAETGSTALQEIVFRNLVDISVLRGDHEKALDYQLALQQLKDSLFSEEKTRAFAEIETIHKTKEQEQALRELEASQTIDKLQLANRERSMMWLFLALFILGIILAFVFYQYRQKRQALEQLDEQHQRILEQKQTIELLYKELNHRVRNNLQVVTDMFEIQVLETSNEDVERILQIALKRLEAIALIHSNLTLKSVNQIDLKRYTDDLAYNVIMAFGLNKSKVEYSSHIDIETMDVDTAVSFGLLLNELISNSCEHALRNASKPALSICIEPLPENRVKLKISDSGTGLPSDFDMDNSARQGLKLVVRLLDQLNGNLSWENDNGLHITIEVDRGKLLP